MKKFLSLVLALIMTMSLVTISAGATEYKDLTDKDEIQYEEAVAVLNRIGVITGYDDGSFRPETELTRGAAAKIIVSLLIGPEAASNLPNTYAPYPDVPANHTFAGVISYCKTAGIISGYGDGTFKPANSLTGYAFAKMLLGAIGYDSKIQGYTDTGWTMNVARDGNMAGLFNRIEFDGAAAVNREQACQLALNTLKATMVEYTGGLNVTAGDAHVTSNPTLTYKISNQEYAKHISERRAGGLNSDSGNANINNHYTVEFGEEHFKDLRMKSERANPDQFGRPSNEWSYKKVTIGTFPIEPDFVYTTQVIHNDDVKVTDAAKVRALELNGYELKLDGTKESEPVDTTLWLNGEKWTGTDLEDKNDNTDAAEYSHHLETVGDIADFTDNGTRVEVYVDEEDADFIRDVVVVKTQLMEVKSLKSEAVALKLYDDGADKDHKYIGFNSTPINQDVNDVQINDDCYNTLKDMKVGDIVAVIPVWTGVDSKYDVAKVYTPETVSGELTNVETYGRALDGSELEAAVTATVGGTDYKVALWNKDLTDIDGTKIRVTRKDITLFLDEYGNALLAKDVGSTSNFMVVGGYHSGLVDGKVVTFVDGWDIKGNEISLNVGNINYDWNAIKNNNSPYAIGNLVHYSSDTHSKYAEWDLDYLGVFDVASKRDNADDATKNYSLKASSSKVLLNGWTATGDGKNSTIVDTTKFYKGNDDALNAAGDAGTGVPTPAAGTFPATSTPVTRNVDVDDGGIKVIYVTMDTDDNEVDSIEIKDGMQAISYEEIMGFGSTFTHQRAQACVNLKSDNTEVQWDDSTVKAIVIKEESGSANLSDLVYISNYIGSAGVAAGRDKNSKPVYGYEAHFVGKSDYDKAVTIYSYKDLNRGDFARARLAAEAPTEVKNVTEENFYNLTRYGDTVDGRTTEKVHKALSVLPFAQIKNILRNNKTLLRLTEYDLLTKGDTDIVTYAVKANERTDKEGIANISLPLNDISELDLGDEKANSVVSINKAKFIDLTDNDVDSASDLKDLWNDVTDAQKAAYGKDVHRLINLTLLFNDKYDDDGFRDVHAVIITSAPKSAVYTVKGGAVAGTLTIKDTDPTGIESSSKKTGDALKAADTIEVVVKSGYEAEAPVADATVAIDGLKYTFTVTEKGAKDGVTITIKKAAAGSVVVASTAVDRYGNKLLTIKDGSSSTSLNPTTGTVTFYAQATAPAWVDLAGTDIVKNDITSVTYTIYHNGAPVTVETKQLDVSGASGRNFTLTGTTTVPVGFTGTAKIEITGVKYASSVVRYFANNTDTPLAKTDMTTDTVFKLSTTANSVAIADFKAAVLNTVYKAAAAPTTAGQNGDATLAGVLKDDTTDAITKGAGTTSLIQAAGANAKAILESGAARIYAKGDGYVDVVITGLVKIPDTYTLTVPATKDAPEDDTKKVTFVKSPNAAVDPAGQITLSAWVDAAMPKGVYGYTISAIVKDKDGNTVKTLTSKDVITATSAATAMTVGSVTMDGNYTIAAEDITLAAVTTPAVSSMSATDVKLGGSGTTLTVTFDRKITAADKNKITLTADTGTAPTVTDAQVVEDGIGKTLQITLSKAAVAADVKTIDFAAAAVCDADYTKAGKENQNIAFKITPTWADGTFTTGVTTND